MVTLRRCIFYTVMKVTSVFYKLVRIKVITCNFVVHPLISVDYDLSGFVFQSILGFDLDYTQMISHPK